MIVAGINVVGSNFSPGTVSKLDQGQALATSGTGMRLEIATRGKFGPEMMMDGWTGSLGGTYAAVCLADRGKPHVAGAPEPFALVPVSTSLHGTAKDSEIVDGPIFYLETPGNRVGGHLKETGTLPGIPQAFPRAL